MLAESEYHAAETIPPFVKELEHDFGFRTVCLINQTPGTSGIGLDRNSLPHMEELDDADLVILQMRRRALPAEQMDHFRRFLDRGGALIGIRTASHAFAARDPKPDAPADPKQLRIFHTLARWPHFDEEVLGCHYNDHYKTGTGTVVHRLFEMRNHPILKGVPPEDYHSDGSLYLSRPLTKNCQVLLLGLVLGKPVEPVAWTNQRGHSRIFYTSLGHWNDWKIPAFRRMMRNAVFWALRLPVPGGETATSAPERAR